MRLRLPRLSLWFLAALLVSRVYAHDPFEMTADCKLTPQKFQMRVTMTQGTAWALIEKTLPKRTKFDPSKLDKFVPAFEAEAGTIFSVSAGGEPLPLEGKQVRFTQEEDVEFILDYAPPKKSPLRIEASHVRRMGYGYGASVMITSESNRFLGSKLLMDEDPALELPLASLTDSNNETVNGKIASPPEPARPSFSFKSYVLLGIEHILTGYDHLLFLAALLVACRRGRSILVIITCFTVAHSLTLGLAALDLVTLSPRIVEPLIAVTIMYVAVENLWRRGAEPKGRGWLTFTFGLIHGFGFASALKETGLGRDPGSLVMPLFSFNLGVELGQLTVAAICLPLWWKLRDLKPVERYGALTVSCVVALAGLYWFLQRTVL